MVKNLDDQIAAAVEQALADAGIDLEDVRDDSGEKPKVVVLAADLRASASTAQGNARDQVVMARIDRESSDQLDMWVASGIAKSRSEAAAIFISEGLKLRAEELAKIKKAYRSFEKAKADLEREAQAILGGDSVS